MIYFGFGHAYHAGLNDSSLDTSDGNSANTTDLVHILERQTKRLVSRTLGRINSINGLQKGLASSLSLGLLLPSFIPWAVLGLVNHVIAVESRDRDEGNSLGVIPNLLDKVGCLFDDLVVTVTGPFGSVHFVDSHDELLNAQGVGKQSVLTCLTILRDTSFEFTSTGSDDEDSAISLRGASDHVLDKVTVTWGVCLQALASMRQ